MGRRLRSDCCDTCADLKNHRGGKERERIIAGKEYIENEGNGDVKHYYETVLKPHDTILKGE